MGIWILALVILLVIKLIIDFWIRSILRKEGYKPELTGYKQFFYLKTLSNIIKENPNSSVVSKYKTAFGISVSVYLLSFSIILVLLWHYY